MELLRTLHITCAILTGLSFFLRGVWMLRGSSLLQARLTRIFPHVIDSILLVSALAMVWQLSLNPLVLPWLLAKILALFLYIFLGLVAFRFGKTRQVKVVCWALALLVLGFIYATAITKTVFFLSPAV